MIRKRSWMSDVPGKTWTIRMPIRSSTAVPCVPEGFRAEFASELEWGKPGDKVLEWTPPDVRWFLGATRH